VSSPPETRKESEAAKESGTPEALRESQTVPEPLPEELPESPFPTPAAETSVRGGKTPSPRGGRRGKRGRGRGRGRGIIINRRAPVAAVAPTVHTHRDDKAVQEDGGGSDDEVSLFCVGVWVMFVCVCVCEGVCV
jgi:hypothetical protein